MKRLLAVLGLITCPLIANAATHEVQVIDVGFSPSVLTIAPGDTVRWVNAAGGMTHDVTADDFSFNSITANAFEFEVTFPDPGNVPYHCTVHSSPAAQGGTAQNGTIIVQGMGGVAELELLEVAVTGGLFEPGQDLSIRTMIRNNGAAASSGYDLELFLSKDQVVGEDDLALATLNAAGVAASATDTRNDTVSLPDLLPPGTWFVVARLAFDDENSANNENFDAQSLAFLATVINAGVNDVWVSLDTLGQGFFFIIFPDVPLFFASWFTFETERPDPSITAILGEPGHRWLVASGGWVDNVATLDVANATGGVFDSPDFPVDQPGGYGTWVVTFHDCNNATITYEMPSANVAGSIELTRVAFDNVALCEALANTSE